MAKKFAGFKPETMQKKILPALGYDGPMTQAGINAFLAANPAAAAKMGKYTLAARRVIEGAPVKMAKGGDTKKPEDSSGDKFTKAITADPTKLVTEADIAKTTDEQKQEGTIATTTGQAGDASQAGVTTAGEAAKVEAPDDIVTTTVDTTKAAGKVDEALKDVEAAKGEVSEEAQIEAAQGDPAKLSALKLEAAQGEAAKVEKVAPRKVEEGEMIEGSTVDMERVKKEVNFEAATGSPSTEATVQGQLTGLMEDFEGSEPPPWAAGAMRAAASAMASRGLGSSSMAGQAIIQSAMESALPVAMADAQTFARFEEQNLSNRQQAAMLGAQERAKFLGMEFDQAFQARVANAAKISDIANINFTAEQQVALENARMANTMNLANLDAKNAKVLSDAAAMSQMDLTNLSNQQIANVENAKNFLTMDMANLDNEQQTSLFKAQERANAILSDTAAENATKQFNATSENQTKQFMASMQTQVQLDNANRKDAQERFNAGETNALAQFNTAQDNARDQFNAQNHLIVAQANAAWFQSITTAENAAQNQANRDAALQANNLTMTAYNNIVQRERDILSWAWQSAENASQRDSAIAIAKIGAEDDDSGSLLSAAAGAFLGAIADEAASYIFA